MQPKAKKKNIGGLLGLLSVDATQDVNNILAKHGIAKSNNPSDLVQKLADLYRNAPDKRILEKELVEIHPHKDFILKYSEQLPATSKVVSENIKFGDEQEVKQMLKQYISTAPPINEFSNCEGNPNCNCHKKMSNACGGCSSFSGFDSSNGVALQGGSPQNNNKDLIIGGLILVTVLGLFLHHKHS